MEQVNQKSKTRVKKKYKYNRIYLNDGADKKLSNLMSQVNDYFSGMVKVNKNDLASMIIDGHSGKFSKGELGHLQKAFLTDLQKAKWIVLQIEKAKKEGLEVNFESLVTKAQSKTNKKKSPKSKALTTPEKE